MRSLQDQSGWCAKLQWMLAGILSLLAIGFYLGIYRPTTARLNDLTLGIDAKQRQLDADAAQAGRYPQVKLSVEKLRLRLDNFDKKLPRRDDLGQFIDEISRAGAQASLRKFSVQPSVQRRTDAFCEWPIVLHFEGDFDSVATFLRQTEQMQRLTRVRHLKMTTTDPKLGTVQVDMTVNIFYTKT